MILCIYDIEDLFSMLIVCNMYNNDRFITSLVSYVHFIDNYESPEGSFEIRDSISEIRDSKFNIPIKHWVER